MRRRRRRMKREITIHHNKQNFVLFIFLCASRFSLFGSIKYRFLIWLSFVKEKGKIKERERLLCQTFWASLKFSDKVYPLTFSLLARLEFYLLFILKKREIQRRERNEITNYAQSKSSFSYSQNLEENLGSRSLSPNLGHSHHQLILAFHLNSLVFYY